jgi:hypothetical protein
MGKAIQPPTINKELAMNISTSPQPTIFSATGLPKAVLAGLFRGNGLFGRDSELSPAEQAVIQARLPAIRGLRAPSAAITLTPRHAALSALADAALAGRETVAEAARAQATGVKPSAISEVVTTVQDAKAVFGPFAVTAGKVQETGETQPLSIAA